ncbi:MAG TPA: endonuclease/exonuclease/phosphatase family protein, partial [Ktedonobacteraceae bacterium]|nr:endonuclease/exonuclease/phosphatase family protein [Ktedonobacteraceae bacterium]
MRVISWNVNGLADKKKARQVLRRLHSFKADVIILQEIYKNTSKLPPNIVTQKVEEIASMAKYVWKTDMLFDSSGKLAILSHYHNSLELISTFSDGRIMDFKFSHIAKGDRKIKITYFTMNFRAVYAPAVSGTQKSRFWTKFPPLPPLTWVVGDFNLALHQKDRSARTSSDNPGMVNDILEHHLDTQYLLQNRRPKPTFHHPSTSKQHSSRIDYIFAPDSQLRPCARFRLEGPGLLSDHSILILDNLDNTRKTAPPWRMNIQLLANRKVNTD